MSIKLIAIIGKSGSGKNTILNRFTEIPYAEIPYSTPMLTTKEIDKFKQKYHIVVPFTTRPMRQGEVEGVDYHFLDDDNIGELIEDGSVAQVEDFRGWLYGTLWSELKEDKLNIGIFNPRAVEHLADYVDLDITTVYITAPDKDRLLRQLQREDNPDVKEIVRRYGTDEEDFTESELEFLPNMVRINNPNISAPNNERDMVQIYKYVTLRNEPINKFRQVVKQVGNFD